MSPVRCKAGTVVRCQPCVIVGLDIADRTRSAPTQITAVAVDFGLTIAAHRSTRQNAAFGICCRCSKTDLRHRVGKIVHRHVAIFFSMLKGIGSGQFGVDDLADRIGVA